MLRHCNGYLLPENKLQQEEVGLDGILRKNPSL